MDESFDDQPLATRYQLISSYRTRIPLKRGAIAAVHILPTCKGNLNLSEIVASNQRRLTPLVVSNTNLNQQLMNNALIYFRNSTCYLEALADGKIETAYSNTAIFPDNKIISYHLERAIYRSIRNNLKFYIMQTNDQIVCPVKLKLALLNIKGYKLTGSSLGNATSRNEIVFNTEIINEFQENTIHRAIHNLTNKIWVYFGEQRSIHFDEEHRFIENESPLRKTSMEHFPIF